MKLTLKRLTNAIFVADDIYEDLPCNFNNNNIYLLQLGCHPVAVVILHVYEI